MEIKKNILILCGGQNTEHEISILSANNVVQVIDREKYNVALVYIQRDGKWSYYSDVPMSLPSSLENYLQTESSQTVAIVPGDVKQPLISLGNVSQRFSVDCVFPVLHGYLGEDGTLQGMLEILNLPYVGPDVLGSALCMEKHYAKKILRAAGLPTMDYVSFHQGDRANYSYHMIQKQLGDVMFVKPAATGSSVGINKVKNESQFEASLDEAFRYDDEVIIEVFVPGREIECSVFGNRKLVASLPGEVITRHEFYSYEAKYIDPNGADVITPADLPEHIVEKVRALSIKACEALHVTGMARVDFLVDGEEIIINELNTIPGFTDISMYAKNWEASGLGYSDLVDKLIHLAFERQQQQITVSKERNQIEMTQ